MADETTTTTTEAPEETTTTTTEAPGETTTTEAPWVTDGGREWKSPAEFLRMRLLGYI